MATEVLQLDATTATGESKTCARCSVRYDDPSEHFYRARSGVGFQSRCKACERASAKERHHANRDANLARMRERNRDPEFRQKKQEYNREYYAANRDSILAWNRRYHEENREQRRSYLEQWKRRNPSYYQDYEKNRRKRPEGFREWQRAYMRQWLQENPLMQRARVTRYRARKLKAQGSHSAADVRWRYAAQQGRCYWCKVAVGDEYHVDHVIPLSRGGSNGRENIVIACPTCNRKKGDKMPEEFAGVLL